MSIVLKKRRLLAATLVIALGAAVFINWYYTKPQTAATQSGQVSEQKETQENLGDASYVNATGRDVTDYFAAAKLKRSSAHAQAKENLESVLQDDKSTKSATQQAAKSLEALSSAIKLETDIENLISAKINGECLVMINGEKADAVVEKGKLDATRVMQIKEIMQNKTQFPPQNITIVELSS